MKGLVLLWIMVAVVTATWFTLVCNSGNAKLRLFTKIIASSCFVILGIVCCSQADPSTVFPSYSILLTGALTFGFVGDVLLGLRKVLLGLAKRLFLGGLVSFLVGHIFYIMLFSHIQPVSKVTLLIFILMLVTLPFIKKPAGIKLGSMAMPCVIYMVVISLMLSIALGNLIMLQTPLNIVLALGAALFAFSDFLLTLFLFSHSAPHWVRSVYPAVYFSAQILMALSPLFISR